MQTGVIAADVAEDHFVPRYRSLFLRIANRLLHSLQLRELEAAIRSAVVGFRPYAIVVYKGVGIGAGLLEEMRRSGIPVINVFPDHSPHAYGRRLQEAMGCYDLVLSTKPFIRSSGSRSMATATLVSVYRMAMTLRCIIGLTLRHRRPMTWPCAALGGRSITD